jgi:hypothetical protein
MCRLQALGFRFPVRRCSTLLDTAKIAEESFGYWVGSLSKVLRTLGCPYDGLHCAGNDANFTLKALFLLAAKGLGRSDKDRDMVNILWQIGKKEIPSWFDPEAIAITKRDKTGRKNKNKRHCSATEDWSLHDDMCAVGRQLRKDIEDGTKKAPELIMKLFNRKDHSGWEN